MEIPLELTLRDIENTESIETDVRQKTQKLRQYFDNIEFCKTVIDIPQKHKHQGRLYNVSVQIGVPGKKIVANHHPNEDLYVAIRDAYLAIQRQLEEYAARQRGDVKVHPESLVAGHIARLFTGEGYGFIESNDGRELFFQRGNLVSGEFEDLVEGELVSFMEVLGGDGMQADRVSVMHRRTEET